MPLKKAIFEIFCILKCQLETLSPKQTS